MHPDQQKDDAGGVVSRMRQGFVWEAPQTTPEISSALSQKESKDTPMILGTPFPWTD